MNLFSEDRSHLIHWKDKVQDIWWDIIIPFKFMRWRWRDFVNGIENVIKYIPAVWSDWDFEAHSIYRMLYYKLKYQEEFFMSDRPWCVGAKNTGKQIKIAKCLAKRLWDNDYLSNALIPHEAKYPHLLYRNFKAIPEYDAEGRIKWYKHVNEATEDETTSFRKCSQHGEKMRKQDSELLFKMLDKRIAGWWD